MQAVSRVLVPRRVTSREGGTHSSSTRVTTGIERSSLVVRTGSPISGLRPELHHASTLHQVGFAVPGMSPSRRCALTAPFHPCLPKNGMRGRARRRPPCAPAFAGTGGLFSVALSLGLPPLVVSQHPCPAEPGLYLSSHPGGRNQRAPGPHRRKSRFKERFGPIFSEL